MKEGFTFRKLALLTGEAKISMADSIASYA